MIQKKEKSYLASVLSKLIDEWKRETGMTQDDLAELVGVATSNSVSDWRTGKTTPSKKNLAKLCEVLGVEEWVFEPITRADRWKYSTDFITKVGRSRAEFAEKIGFDLELLTVLRRLVNFEESFPIYSDIEPKLATFNSYVRYFRNPEFMDCMTISDEELKDLQIERDGKLITLTNNDLKFLKDVQDELARYAEYLFYKRSMAMEEELIDASREFYLIGEDKHTPTREEFRRMEEDYPHDGVENVKRDSYEVLSKIDKYGVYEKGIPSELIVMVEEDLPPDVKGKISEDDKNLIIVNSSLSTIETMRVAKELAREVQRRRRERDENENDNKTE